MQTPKTWLILSLLLLIACQQKGSEEDPARPQLDVDSLGKVATPLAPDRGMRRNGMLHGHPSFSSIFQRTSLDTFDLPIVHAGLIAGLDRQLQLLEQTRPRKTFRIGDLRFDLDHLEESVSILRSRQHTKPVDLYEVMEAYQIWGGDRRGNVLFTGYFTPVVAVSDKPDGTYRYPVYKRPRNWSGALPSRWDIEMKGALRDQGLEIAYARNKVDVYYMQLQGSGMVEYPDGTRKLLSYDGTNRQPYRSIEKYLLSREDLKVPSISIAGVRSFMQRNPQLVDSILCHNPSYTFFKVRNSMPRGAGNVPLQGGLSVAVDRRYIPLGSCLLAAIPIFDKRTNRVAGHEYRFLLAQDVGGRIKGPGHVDLYFGIGDESRSKAMLMKHYGRIWLLLPKQSPGLLTMR